MYLRGFGRAQDAVLYAKDAREIKQFLKFVSGHSSLMESDYQRGFVDGLLSAFGS